MRLDRRHPCLQRRGFRGVGSFGCLIIIAFFRASHSLTTPSAEAAATPPSEGGEPAWVTVR